MKVRNAIFYSFVGVLMGLGLFVNSAFFLVGAASLCGGHMLLGHNHGDEHARNPNMDEDAKRIRQGCH